MTQVDEKALRAELDALGLQEVEIRVAKSVYGNTTARRRLVDQWIEEQKRAQDSAHDAAQADAASRAAKAAERAADAAERAADTAERALDTARAANTRATIALIITAVSIIVTVVLFYLRPS